MYWVGGSHGYHEREDAIRGTTTKHHQPLFPEGQVLLSVCCVALKGQVMYTHAQNTIYCAPWRRAHTIPPRGGIDDDDRRVAGVVSSEVSLPLERATVFYDSEVTTPEQVRVARSHVAPLRGTLPLRAGKDSSRMVGSPRGYGGEGRAP